MHSSTFQVKKSNNEVIPESLLQDRQASGAAGPTLSLDRTVTMELPNLELACGEMGLEWPRRHVAASALTMRAGSLSRSAFHPPEVLTSGEINTCWAWKKTVSKGDHQCSRVRVGLPTAPTPSHSTSAEA